MKSNSKTTHFRPNEHFVIGLRVYNQALESGRNKDIVFYTQRTHGPFYTWHYDRQLGQWRPVRVHTNDLQPQDLCIVTWKTLPHQLRAQLRDHYVDY